MPTASISSFRTAKAASACSWSIRRRSQPTCSASSCCRRQSAASDDANLLAGVLQPLGTRASLGEVGKAFDQLPVRGGIGAEDLYAQLPRQPAGAARHA